MTNYWQPDIDKWIPESFAGNTEHVKSAMAYVPPPHLSDYVGNQSYAPGEGEEIKVNIAGKGKLSIKDIKGKISQHLKDILDLVDSDKISDIEQIEHRLFKEPDLHNTVTEYVKSIKELKAQNSGLT